MKEIENLDPLLNRKQAARYLNKSPGTLANWVCTKRYNLNIVKIGRSVHYRKSDLDNLLNQSLVYIQPS